MIKFSYNSHGLGHGLQNTLSLPIIVSKSVKVLKEWNGYVLIAIRY